MARYLSSIKSDARHLASRLGHVRVDDPRELQRALSDIGRFLRDFAEAADDHDHTVGKELTSSPR